MAKNLQPITSKNWPLRKTKTGEKMDTVSNYVQFTEILADYPSIKILEDSATQDVLDRVISKYHVNNLHYFWSKANAPIINCIRMRLRDLPAHYEKILPTLFSGSTYLMIDLCDDDRFLVYQGHLNSLIELLKINYFELTEIYLLNDALHIRFCVNHVCEVFEFDG